MRVEVVSKHRKNISKQRQFFPIEVTLKQFCLSAVDFWSIKIMSMKVHEMFPIGLIVFYFLAYSISMVNADLC